MATLNSLVWASEAVEQAVTREPEPRVYAPTATSTTCWSYPPTAPDDAETPYSAAT